MELSAGKLLLSDPFLKDPNFARSVILLCEYNTEGAFGLVLNKRIGPFLGNIVEQANGLDLAVYEGGPVQQNDLHFIHRNGVLIPDGIEVAKGIFWGGDFDLVIHLLRQKKISPNDIRFFVGYSGWSTGQLEEEVEEKSWIVTDAKSNMVFHPNERDIWKKSLHNLGGEYALMSNYPTDPQLN